MTCGFELGALCFNPRRVEHGNADPPVSRIGAIQRVKGVGIRHAFDAAEAVFRHAGRDQCPPCRIGAGARQAPVAAAAAGITKRIGVAAHGEFVRRGGDGVGNRVHQFLRFGAEHTGARTEHGEIGAFDKLDAQAIVGAHEADLALQALQGRIAGQPRGDDFFDHAETAFIGGAALAIGCRLGVGNAGGFGCAAGRLRHRVRAACRRMRRDALIALDRAAAHDAV